MPAARFWRVVGLDTYGGGDLELSGLHLYDASGRVDAVAALTSSHVPDTGTLAALQDADDATVCGFVAPAVSASGFWLLWDFGGSPKDVNNLRLGSGATLAGYLTRCILQFHDGSGWVTLRLVFAGDWPGANTLAPLAIVAGSDVVMSLLHLDGPNGGTAITDATGRPWTNNGVTISDSTPNYGGGSGYFNGLSHLSTAASSDFDFGAGDFTIEALVRFAVLPGSGAVQAICGCYSVGTAISWLLYCYNSGGTNYLYFDCSYDGVSGFYAITASFAPTVGVRYHVAVARSSGRVRLYLDGVEIGNQPLTGALAATLGGPMRVGCYYSGGNVGFFNGYMEEIRVQKGAAQYTAGFTPPVGPLSFGTLPMRAQQTAVTSPYAGYSTPGSVQAMSTARQSVFRDLEFGGPGRVRNTVKEKGAPNLPVRRRVRLVRERDGMVVREQWSDPATGAYDFQFVDERQTYTVLSYDHTLDFRAVIADGLTLANGTVELMP